MSNVLITGANRGLGLAFARKYRQRGETVIGTARNPDEAQELADTGARVEALDVNDGESVASLADRLGETPVDLLVLNAGILADDPWPDFDPQSVLEQLETNALGPLRVVQALRRHLDLSEAPKVIAVSSVMGSIEETTDGGYYGYRSSKAALNAIVRTLSVDLKPTPVTAVHPGYVKTRMTNQQGHVTPDESVADLVQLIDRVDQAMSGRFFDRHGQELPW